MNTKELSNRLTQIVQGITNTHPIRIKAISIHGLGDLGKYNSRPSITYEGN